jgi:phosphatidylglycerophosphatase A
MRRRLAHLVGTFFYVGFVPVVPATWTSLVVGLLYLLVPLQGWWLQGGFLVLCLLAGVPACTALEEDFGPDPKQATVDEAAGMAVSLLGVAPTPIHALLAFVLFRFFDVVKPWPGRRAEHLPGGWGVMADDVVAGLYTRAAMAVILWWI